LLGVHQYQAAGKALNAVYLVDHQLGIKVFADEAFFAVNDKNPQKPKITPFLLKRDAEAYAKANGGQTATYAEAIKDAANFTP
jgi:NitT/TauT family transport system substrate-binding protein